MTNGKNVLDTDLLFDLSVWEEAWKNRPRSSKYKKKSVPFNTEEAFERWAGIIMHSRSLKKESSVLSALWAGLRIRV